MAFQTALRYADRTFAPAAGRAVWPESMPSGSLIAVFENRAKAAGVVVQTAVDNPNSRAWLLSGPNASEAIREARARRSVLQRLLAALSDEDRIVDELAAQGGTILAVSNARADRFSQARHLIKSKRWTIQRLR